jgi:hypothetical protein
MANVFGILTALVLAAAIIVANKNKSVYSAKLEDVVKQERLQAAETVKLETAKVSLAGLPEKRSEAEKELATVVASESTVQEANSKLKADVDQKTAKIAENKTKLDEFREKTQKVGDIKELSSKMAETSQASEKISQDLAAAEAKLANLTSLNAQAESQVKAGRAKIESFTGGQSLPSLKTSIRSIYPTWGFVTLASGNNAGVAMNSTLDVIRDGKPVAKLLVTAVESSSASASIVPDSLAADVTLMAGDRVVAGQKAIAPIVPAAATN